MKLVPDVGCISNRGRINVLIYLPHNLVKLARPRPSTLAFSGDVLPRDSVSSVGEAVTRHGAVAAPDRNASAKKRKRRAKENRTPVASCLLNLCICTCIRFRILQQFTTGVVGGLWSVANSLRASVLNCAKR